MPISCDPNDLATAATCFSELSWRQRQEIRVYLLCTLVNGDTPVDCTPDALAAAAACYNKLSSGQLDQIETYLFCQLAGGGVGGNTIYTGDGSLAGDRTIDGAGFALVQNSMSYWQWQSDPTYATPWVTFTLSTSGSSLEISDSTHIQYSKLNLTKTAATLYGDTTCTLDSLGAVVLGSTNVQVGVDPSVVLSFFGAAGSARVASADQAVATDPASTMALANAIRSALVSYGAIKGAA